MMSWHKFVQSVKTILSSCLLTNSWPLQKEIADENEDLAAAKRIVNSNVSQINQEIVSFPASIVAGVKGIHQVPFLAEETQGKKDLSDLNYDLN